MEKCKKILIVEDNSMNRVLLRNILEHYGYEVVDAEDGKRGIETAGREKPDLIFMDIMMPVMDGFTALKELRADPATRNMKVYALTSFAMKGDEQRIMAAGFDGYLSKPLDMQKVLELARRIQHECETTAR